MLQQPNPGPKNTRRSDRGDDVANPEKKEEKAAPPPANQFCEWMKAVALPIVALTFTVVQFAATRAEQRLKEARQQNDTIVDVSTAALRQSVRLIADSDTALGDLEAGCSVSLDGLVHASSISGA